MATSIRVTGLTAYVRVLKGPVFKDINRELRVVSKKIAEDIRPEVVSAVRQSKAPQAWPMSATVRVHSDRVPVVVVGKVNPKFARSPFRHKGGTAAQSKRRRGAMAHGVVYGPKGGKVIAAQDVNYYKISRDETGGALGKSMSRGRVMAQARKSYIREYYRVLNRHGLNVQRGRL